MAEFERFQPSDVELLKGVRTDPDFLEMIESATEAFKAHVLESEETQEACENLVAAYWQVWKLNPVTDDEEMMDLATFERAERLVMNLFTRRLMPKIIQAIKDARKP